MSLPIRVRMTVWYVALLAVIIAAVGAFVVVRLHADLVSTMDARLRSAIVQIAASYHAEGPPEARDVASTILSGEAAAAQVLTPDGRVVVSFGDRVAATPMLGPSEIRAALAGRPLRRTVALSEQRRPFRLTARATSRGPYPRVAVAGESLATVDRSTHRLVLLLLLAGPAALVATGAGGWWLARRSLRPIDRLTTDAGRVGVDQLDHRLPVPATADEVAHLATTLNTMLARIHDGVEDQRRLVADASHELRSPLAAMRAELDVSLRADDLGPDARATLESTREEVERLARTVDGLLALAQADGGALALNHAPVDLAVVAAETIDRLGPLARSRDVTVDANLGPAPMRGDAVHLGRATANLVDNALKYTPAGSVVTVMTGVDGTESRLSVVDAGPGIPPEAREIVFDRFRRLDASRTRTTGGSGLGLAIVRETARAHGGRVWNEPGPHGGTRFVLALPLGGRP